MLSHISEGGEGVNFEPFSFAVSMEASMKFVYAFWGVVAGKKRKVIWCN